MTGFSEQYSVGLGPSVTFVTRKKGNICISVLKNFTCICDNILGEMPMSI